MLGDSPPASLYFSCGSAWRESETEKGIFHMIQVRYRRPQSHGSEYRLSQSNVAHKYTHRRTHRHALPGSPLSPPWGSRCRLSNELLLSPPRAQSDKREHVVIVASERLSPVTEDWLEVPHNHIIQVLLPPVIRASESFVPLCSGVCVCVCVCV